MLTNKINNIHFKKILILFWALWWLIAAWTDIVGGLAHLGLLKSSWAPDLNYPALVDSLKMYHTSSFINASLFIGILLWATLSAVTFIWTCFAFNQTSRIWMKRAEIAFIISLSLWLAFFLADQIVMKFDFEENHMVQGGFELLCFLAFYILPNQTDAA